MNQGRIDLGGDDNKSTHKDNNDGDNGEKSAGEQLAMKHQDRFWCLNTTQLEQPQRMICSMNVPFSETLRQTLRPSWIVHGGITQCYGQPLNHAEGQIV